MIAVYLPASGWSNFVIVKLVKCGFSFGVSILCFAEALIGSSLNNQVIFGWGIPKYIRWISQLWFTIKRIQ